MEETIIFPSPNWFQACDLAVSSDNWIIYGGPSKSLCVLEPLPMDCGDGVIRSNQGYQAHFLIKAHPEKIVRVDISPEWPAKRAVLTGSADGTVKQFSFERIDNSLQIKSTHSHEIHVNEKEEIAGVGYCNNGYAVTVGSYGQIVKWDLNSNVAKNYNLVLKSFKPVCMACSPHIHLNVAIGTKQGVIFVLDLNGGARVLYKVRGQDDEIIKVSWCPQYEVTVRKSLKESDKRSTATQKMEQIRHEPEDPEVIKEIDKKVQDAVQKYPKKRLEELSKEIEELQNLEISSSSEVIETKECIKNKTDGTLNVSGIGKTLPDDSFDETMVEEDDMFDIYKDHESDEFGHKKYQPEDIVVKIKQEVEKVDYLEECEKLKMEILKRKNESESTIVALVDAMDKVHVDDEGGHKEATESINNSTKNKVTDVSSVHIHKHLLATVGRHGSIRVWSKTGKLVSSCAVHNSGGKNQKGQKHSPNWMSLYWYKPDILLIADGKNQLLECNPLKIDCKNKLQWKIVHNLHKRGIHTIASSAPRVQTSEESVQQTPEEDWSIWTTSQDRYMICYSMKKRQPLSVHNTCGGYVYAIKSCPYDAKKVAVAIGDGSLRVWETDTLDDDDTKLSLGHVATYWQNVQGKVLNVAWHPTRENWLAFGTAEARVGVIETGGRVERPARPLVPALVGGVYAVCWGAERHLYACASGLLVRYDAHAPDEAPTPIRIELEGQKWEVSEVRWYTHSLVCGSTAGGVAVLSPAEPHQLLAAAFVYSKIIHTIDWHPLETSSSSEESPYKNLIAVCSVDKVNTIVILEFSDKEDGTKHLTVWKTLSGHKNTVLQVAWSPHVDEQLLSTSQDCTVRIWNVESGLCTHIFGGHTQSAMSAAWCAFPQLANKVLSGGADCCLRMWDLTDYPASAYNESNEGAIKKERKKREKKEKKEDRNRTEEESSAETEEQGAAILEAKIKSSKKFLLPMMYKQMNPCKINALRKMLRQYLENQPGSNVEERTNVEVNEKEDYDTDYLKIFGTINDVNAVLDIELERHEDMGNIEPWMMLNIFRGYIDSMIQFASQRDLLDPFLISIAPCVSFKYWKDVMQLYITQIDRLTAKGQECKLAGNKDYGGAVYRKAATLLSLHDIKSAVSVLTDAHLFKEAYILCRTRYVDSIAEETLLKWAQYCNDNGNCNMAAVCYIALGDLAQAATILGKSSREESLSLAADLAKVVGQTTFADHIEKKREKMKSDIVNEDKYEKLPDLPSRLELLTNNDLKEREKTDVIDDEADQDRTDSIDVNTESHKKMEESLQELPTKMELLMKSGGTPRVGETNDYKNHVNGEPQDLESDQ